MSHQRWYRPLTTAATLLGAGLLGAGLLGGCSGAPPTPQATAAAYLAAWARQDWAAMQKLTSRPPADFTAVNQAAFRNLTVRQARFTAGPMRGHVDGERPPPERCSPRCRSTPAGSTRPSTAASRPARRSR